MTRTAIKGAAACVLAAALLALPLGMTASGSQGDSISLNPAAPEPPRATSAMIAPSLSADRLGARAALTLGIRFRGGEFGVPSPVRRSVLRLPAGMSLEVPSLRSCGAARLRARGASGCPAGSRLGGGHALVEAHAGVQTITEDVSLRAFLGPPDNLQPTFEILARGYTPLDERVVFGGSVLTDDAPYRGRARDVDPPVRSLPLEPDASIVTFSLTSAPRERHRTRDRNAVLVPSSCPTGGFPFAGEFTYADGSVGRARAAIPCP